MRVKTRRHAALIVAALLAACGDAVSKAEAVLPDAQQLDWRMADEMRQDSKSGIRIVQTRVACVPGGLLEQTLTFEIPKAGEDERPVFSSDLVLLRMTREDAELQCETDREGSR